MKDHRQESFQQQAEKSIESAALHVARRIHAPGQTKEQTKLIAQGIAKGIALYKKQQSEKLRERDKLRKRLAKQRERGITESSSDDDTEARAGGSAIGTACLAAGIVFGLAAVAHLVRWFVALPVRLGSWDLPVGWSLPIAALAGGLAFWLFRAARTDRNRAGP